MVSFRFLSPVLLAVVVGCGRPETASDKQFAKLRDSLAAVQAEHDELDSDSGRAREESTPNRAAAPRKSGREPRVVRLVPNDGASDGEPTATEAADDSTERPTVRLVGAAGPSGARRRSRGDARLDLAGPADAAASAVPSDDLGPDVAALRQGTNKPPSALDPEAKKSYERALAQVWAKRYDTALEGFAQFLVTWPDHPYADNALYWRGECFFAKGEFAKAAEEFDGAVARFPLGNKASDALMKLAATHEKLGDAAKAAQARERLLRDYPQSDAARKVSARPAKTTDRPVQESP
jgi:tol-pal system protein YbgF